jgi:hypothetical protein
VHSLVHVYHRAISWWFRKCLQVPYMVLFTSKPCHYDLTLFCVPTMFDLWKRRSSPITSMMHSTKSSHDETRHKQSCEKLPNSIRCYVSHRRKENLHGRPRSFPSFNCPDILFSRCCRPRPTDGHWQATREPGGLEPLSVDPADCTHPEVEVRWACHLTYTWSGRCLMCFS